MYKVLITCLGNICRSPAAEHLILAQLKETELGGNTEMGSAGLINPGNMAAGPVRRILGEEMGIRSIFEHRSRVLSPEMIKEQDLILPMGKYEMEGLLSIRSHPNTHLYLDWIYGTGGEEIRDPYGMDFEYYRQMVNLLASTVDDLIARLTAEPR